MRSDCEVTSLEGTEETRQATESRWRAIFDNSAVGIAIADPQGYFIAANRAYQAMVGYTDAELRTMSFMDLTYEDDRPATMALVQELWAGRTQPFQIEKRYRRKDGQLIWVRHTVSRAPSVGTAPPFGMTIAEDITERKRAMEALRESQLRLELSVQASNIGLWDWNVATNEVYLSPEWKSQLGYADHEIANRFEEWESRLHPDDRERAHATDRALFDSGKPYYELESRLRHKDGSYRWILTRASLVRHPNGQPDRMLGLHIDITERKRVEERLREYEKVVESLQEMIVVVDREYRYLIANRAFLDYRGFDRQQVVGRLIPEVVDKDLFDKVIKNKIDECFQGKIVRYELRHSYPRIGTRDLFISYFPISGPAGIDRVAGVLEDVSERKRVEDELQRSFAQLRQLAARMETVREEERSRAARAIHDELGQALTAIKLDLTVLLRDLPQENGAVPERRESMFRLLDEAMQSVRRIATELRPAVLDEMGLVAAVEWAAEEFEARTGTRCQVSLSEEDIAIDRERATALFRIFQETLTNVARHASATRVDVRLGKEDGNVVLEVSDNGRGFDEKRLTPANSLGILGMRERAFLLGGELIMRGAPGKGTVVRVALPEVRQTAAISD